MKLKFTSCFLLFIIAISSMSYANADSIIIDHDVNYPPKLNNVADQIGSENKIFTKHQSLDLMDGLKLVSNDNSINDLADLQKSTIKKSINLSESLTMSEIRLHQESIILVKQNFDRITSMEKIWSIDRIRFDGKQLKIENIPYYAELENDLTHSKVFTEKMYNEISPENIEQFFVLQFDKIIVKQSFVEFTLSEYQKIPIILQNVKYLEQSLQQSANAVANPKNPIILTLLVPFAGFLLIRYEEVKIKYNKNRLLSFFLIVILITSTVISPLPTLGIFVGQAFADMENNSTTNQNTTPQNQTSTTVNSPPPPIYNSTQVNASRRDTGQHSDVPLVNSTTNVPQNLTSSITNSSLPIHNSTQVTVPSGIPSHHRHVYARQQYVYSISDQLSISDSVSLVSNLNSKVSNIAISTLGTNPTLLDQLSMTDSVSLRSPNVNFTTSSGSTVSTLGNNTLLSDQLVIDDSISLNHISNMTQIPNATKSWQFTQLQNSTVGQVQLSNQNNTNSLLLQGNGFLKDNSTSTENLNALSISAWVKPDYSQGSPEFTVISKENSFILSVNNNISPQGMAQFSVFNGIQWFTANSTSRLGQNWSNLAATFNGTTIKIYVNGTLEGTSPVVGLPVLTVRGQMSTATLSNLTSSSDILIGASIHQARDAINNLFSGSISDVTLYKSQPTPAQITLLYQTSPITIQNTPIQSNSIPLSEVMAISDAINPTNSTSGNMTNATMPVLPIVPTLAPSKKDYFSTEVPQFNFQYYTDKDFEKVKKHFGNNTVTPQNGTWNSSNETINVDILDSFGNKVQNQPKFEKIREGKFGIDLSSPRIVKPGLYKIETTLLKDGKTYVTESNFTWGLVALNTNKSIYKPGETGNFTMAVLDRYGQPVCNSDITLEITDPNLQLTTLTSGAGITNDPICGLYHAQYSTISEGNYTVHVNASAKGINTDYTTSFLVSSSYPFDIVRTADTKIDPVDKPNLFNVRIDISSYVSQNNFQIREFVPAVFTNITTDARITTVGDTKILTWNRNLKDSQSKTFVQYSYSVPLDFPELYQLGPVQINYGNQTFTEARPWIIANDPVGDGIVIDYLATPTSAAISSASKTLSIPVTVNQLTGDNLIQAEYRLGTNWIKLSWNHICNMEWIQSYPTKNSPSRFS